MDKLVYSERPCDRVVHIVLNRPNRRNALTGPMVDALAEELSAANEDESITVIVIRGAGNSFCSGLDLKEFGADPQPDWVPEFSNKWRAVHRELFDSDRIVVGALENAAVNGGAALALACDFLIAGESAFLQVGEIQQGMAAPMNMAWLRLRFDEALSGRVALLGDRIRGPELVQLGIAFETVADDSVLGAVDTLCDRLKSHDIAGVRRIKTSLRRTALSDTAQEWFGRALAADPLKVAGVKPVAAANN